MSKEEESINHWSNIRLAPTASLVKLHEISVEAYVPHAAFVPFIGLTSLRTDSGRIESFFSNDRIFEFSIGNNRFTKIECFVLQRQSSSKYPSQCLRSSSPTPTRTWWFFVSSAKTCEEKCPTIGHILISCDDRGVGRKYLDNFTSKFHQSISIQCSVALLWIAWNESLASIV